MSDNSNRIANLIYFYIILIACGIQVACTSPKQTSNINHKPIVIFCPGPSMANSLEMDGNTPILKYKKELKSPECKTP